MVRYMCSLHVDGKRWVWDVERLWRLTADMPAKQVVIDHLVCLDKDGWFGTHTVPTLRNIADHCQRALETDLSHPIILNTDGSLMDGGHRILKAILEGRTTIDAVQFETMPEPDEIRDE